jgi:exodeoxyribonuclease VII small subunit
MSDTPTLGDDIRRLEEIVRRLESEELPIEEALRLFEDGVARLRSARTLLTDAETRVHQVLKESGEIRLAPLDG